MYPLTFYTTLGVSHDARASARGPVIFIRPKHKKDVGIYQHELTHVKQWFCTLGLHSLLYWLVPSYKAWSEIQAFKKQSQYDEQDNVPHYAYTLCKYYGLELNYEETKAAIYAR